MQDMMRIRQNIVEKSSSALSISSAEDGKSLEHRQDLLARRITASSRWRSAAAVKPHQALAAYISSDVNKDFSHKDQDQDLQCKDQDQDKDFSYKDQDFGVKDKDQDLSRKDKDKDFGLTKQTSNTDTNTRPTTITNSCVVAVLAQAQRLSMPTSQITIN